MTTSAALRALAAELSEDMRCNCDLDNWEPEPSTGHSWVCRIHKRATGLMQNYRDTGKAGPLLAGLLAMAQEKESA